MKVADVMTAPAVTVASSATYRDVVDRLVQEELHAVPVVDARGKLVGIISEADVVRGGGHARALGLLSDSLHRRSSAWIGKAAPTTARALMSRSVRTVTAAHDLSFAAAYLLKHDHHLLPVIDERRIVVGVITRKDVLHRFEADDAYVAAEITDVLKNARRAPEGLDVRVSVLGGVVNLRGTTEREEDIDVVRHVIARVPGVLTIRNDLTARGDPGGVKRSESLAWRWHRGV